MRWSREDEGAISDAEHRNVNPATHSPTGPADEVPDNSRKIPIGKNEITGTRLKTSMIRGPIRPEARPARARRASTARRKYLIIFEKPVSSIIPIEISGKKAPARLV